SRGEARRWVTTTRILCARPTVQTFNERWERTTPRLTDGLRDPRWLGLSPVLTCSHFTEESRYKAAASGTSARGRDLEILELALVDGCSARVTRPASIMCWEAPPRRGRRAAARLRATTRLLRCQPRTVPIVRCWRRGRHWRSATAPGSSLK